jgi:hypothetical protein
MGTVVQNNTRDKELSQYVINKYDKLKLYKSSWESHWKELTTYFLPEKSNVWGGSVPGEKKGQELFDSTGRRSSERLASALHGMLTNPSVQWFSFSTGDHETDNKLENAKWLQDTAKTINGILNHSNFQSEIHEVYLDLCSLHTSYLRIEEDEDEVCRFQSRPIYDCSISENYRGVIDTTYHEYKRTLDQLYGEYGNSLPKELLELRFKDPLKEYEIIHAVEPSDRMPERLRHPLLPFTSVKVLKEHFVILKIEGFQENPCIISRFYKLSGEMYGRGPAMYALPDVKTANQMMKVWLEGAQLAINPPLQVPDEGVLLPVRFVPGGTNYYRADSKDRIEPIITGANPQIGNQIIELLHANIQKAFYIDQLHLVESDRMTATEVQMRRDEQLRTLSPILGRLMYELHAPIIVRVMGIASRKGLLTPPPEELSHSKIEIKFVSQLARAQESVEGDSAVRALQTVMQFAQADPTIIDVLDLDATAKFIYKSYGAPLHLLHTEKETKDIKTKREQVQQAAQQAQMDQMNSQSTKNMAQAQAIEPKQ